MEVFHVSGLSERDLEHIVEILRRGGVVAYPTDTAYGLGADPFNREAVNSILKLKGRPAGKPILLFVDSVAMAESVAVPDEMFRKVAARFWPGPLTVILQSQPGLPDEVTAGTGTIGVRWGQAPFAERLVRNCGRPLTATSANRAGEPAPVTAIEVREQLDDGPDALIDGGALPFRGGSTVLDLTQAPPCVLREGPVAFSDLESLLGGRIRTAS